MKTLKIIIGFVGILLSFGTVIKLSLTEPTHASMCILSMTLGAVVVLFFLLLTNSMAGHTNPKTTGLPKFENPPFPPIQKEEWPINKILIEKRVPNNDLQIRMDRESELSLIQESMKAQLIQYLFQNNLVYVCINEGGEYTYLLYELNVIIPKRIYTHERGYCSKLGESPYPKDPNSYCDEMTNQYRKEE